MATQVVKKKVKKAAKKSGAVRGAGGRFAGRVAPKLTQAEDLPETSGPFAEADVPVDEPKTAEEARSEFAAGGEVADGPAARVGDRAEPFQLFPWQQDILRGLGETRRSLLHRRVEVKIFDAKGKQMQVSGFDLDVKDVLSLTVAEKSIVGSISNTEAR